MEASEPNGLRLTGRLLGASQAALHAERPLKPVSGTVQRRCTGGALLLLPQGSRLMAALGGVDSRS